MITRSLTYIFGLLTLAIYFDETFFLFLILIVPLFLIAFVGSIVIGNKQGILAGIATICIIAAAEFLDSEMLKGNVIIEAHLDSDLSSMHLTLRDDNRFEMRSASWMTVTTFSGDYELLGDKIIFKDRPYDKDFIPDTLTVILDKIILRFDANGNPKTDFANYFQITKKE